MKKSWYVILLLLAVGLFFYISKTSEYFVSMNYNRDKYNLLQLIQNVWFTGLLIALCLVGYKTKKILIAIVCATLFICGCITINGGHYINSYILAPAKVTVEEDGGYLVLPLEPEDGIEDCYQAVSLLEEPLLEDTYDWVELDYHDSPKYGSRYHIIQISEQ